MKRKPAIERHRQHTQAGLRSRRGLVSLVCLNLLLALVIFLTLGRQPGEEWYLAYALLNLPFNLVATLAARIASGSDVAKGFLLGTGLLFLANWALCAYIDYPM